MSKKLLITTDVPFWRRQTGAQQRIYALASFLQSKDFTVSTCFTSSLKSTMSDQQAIDSIGIEVHSLVDDWKPEGLWQNVVWQAKCIANAAFPTQADSTNASITRPFSKFASKETARRFQKFLTMAQPDIVVVEYITLAYLVPPATERRQTKFVIDTHDVLSTRNQIFQKQGFEHWVDVSPDEESDALRKFDLILAIQHEEGEQLAKLTQDSVPVVVAGHPIEPNPVNTASPHSDRTTFGILASSNSANQQSVSWFLDAVWSHFAESDELKFVLAGSLGEHLENRQLPDNVEWIGSVDALSDFYQQVDVVVNPVQFGTGLKIKTVEAMAFGKPLITTLHGMNGIDPTSLPCRCAETPEDWIQQIRELAHDPNARESMAKEALEYANSHMRPEIVFAELLKKLDVL